MPDQTRRPLYCDYQPPNLYRVGCALRRSYLTGPAGTADELNMTRLLEQVDRPTTSRQ